MVRFVAVPVDQHDVPGRTRACTAILFEVEVPFVPKTVLRNQRPLLPFLGNSDVACRFEQRIQTTGRGGRFSQKDVGSIKVAKVSNPVGVEDGFTSSNRKSVECADRTARVVLRLLKYGVS
ncbi:MAG: hypothetical protein Udaeo2_22520 [Candidatus Udaeobacter sp.]|nr:MAG: hypothetical protein Udaeo2_22520 [Candidatus Udaeobacter sp.]